MSNTADMPTLYKLTSAGKVQVWKIGVEDNGSYFTIVTTHGQLDGKNQVDRKEIREGKNLGKSNETTPYEQAVSDIQSLWKKKKDKGYVTDIKELDKPVTDFKPMLAHKWTDHSKKAIFPGYVQPKLDGLRCLVYKYLGQVVFESRGGKFFTTLDHITPAFNSMPDNIAFDGELYNHDIPFQTITSLVKKLQDDTHKLNYCAYDLIMPGGFEDRYNHLVKILPKHPNIKLVEAKSIKKADGLQVAHDEYAQQGYEGVMFRNAGGLYKSGYRSYDLLKFKMFEDDEFEIVGVEEGEGRAKGQGIFVCKTKNGNEFTCRIEGEDSYREEIWIDRTKYLGKMLTVRFQGWTDSEPASLRFPVGVSVRDYE